MPHIGGSPTHPTPHATAKSTPPTPTAGGKSISVPTAGNHRPQKFIKGQTPEGPRKGLTKTELPRGMDKHPLGINSSRGLAQGPAVTPVGTKFGGKGGAPVGGSNYHPNSASSSSASTTHHSSLTNSTPARAVVD